MTDEITIVMSADDNFAVGLAGTVKSALHTLSPHRTAKLFVLDGGISDQNKTALLQHWDDSRLAVEWLAVDRRLVDRFVVSDHVTDATYYRLLGPRILPSEISKFIFLDADLLIRRDLSVVWEEPMLGAPCLAVQDIGAPFVDSALALGSNPHDRGALVNECPIPNYESLGLAPANPYFNGGVMVVDLELWRKEGLAEQMLRVLVEQREHVLYWDQYALNVVLSGRWKPLSPLWNQNAIVFRYPGWPESTFCTRQFPSYQNDPWIVHFNWLKPWQADCAHPFADEFLRFLEGSPWHVAFGSRTTNANVSRRKNTLRRLRSLPRELLKALAMAS